MSDAVGCLRAFGSIFLLSGTIALTAGISGAGGLTQESWAERGVVALIGLSHLLGGLLIGWGRWNQTVVTRAGVECFERRPLRSRKVRRFTPLQIRDVLVETEKDNDGDEVFALVLALTSGEKVRVTRHGTPSSSHAKEVQTAVLKRLGRSAPQIASSETGRERPIQTEQVELLPLAVSRRPRRASLQR